MKRLITVLLVVALAFSIVGCAAAETPVANNQASEADASADAPAQDGMVGFINHDLNDPFQQFMLLGGKETAESLGYGFVNGSAENDPMKEQDLIKTFASKGVTMLVLGATTKASGEAAIDLAHELGMTVVTMDSIQPDSLADCQVGGDDVAAGYIAGKQLAESIGGEGKVAIAKYPTPIPPSDDRVVGFYNAFDEYPGIEVIAEDGPDADPIAAQTWATDIMQAHPDVKGFISIMDIHGLGIVRAIENDGKADSVAAVTVVESEDSYKELQNEGSPLKCVVAMHSYNYGAVSVFMLDRINQGRPAPSIVKTTGVAVTSENVDVYMDLIKAQQVD